MWFILTVRPLAAYFIINNRIYQSPDLYTVLSNRLVCNIFNAKKSFHFRLSSKFPLISFHSQLTSLHALQSSLDVLRTHRPDFTPRTGFIWPIVDAPSADSLAKKRATEGSLDVANESSDSLLAAANSDENQQQKKTGPVSSSTAPKKQENITTMQAIDSIIADTMGAESASHAVMKTWKTIIITIRVYQTRGGVPRPIPQDLPTARGLNPAKQMSLLTVGLLRDQLFLITTKFSA